MNAWVLFEGYYCQDSQVIGIFSTKDKLISKCRSEGYKWNSWEGIFLNEKEQKYRKFEGWKMNADEFINSSI